MGADLPALPAEKPFTGKVDEAYRRLPARALPDGDGAGPAARAARRSGGADAGGGGPRPGPRRPAQPRTGDVLVRAGGQAAATRPACSSMRSCLMERSGSKEDRARADELMKKSAELGNASAQFNYGQVLVADSPGDKGLHAPRCPTMRNPPSRALRMRNMRSRRSISTFEGPAGGEDEAGPRVAAARGARRLRHGPARSRHVAGERHGRRARLRGRLQVAEAGGRRRQCRWPRASSPSSISTRFGTKADAVEAGQVVRAGAPRRAQRPARSRTSTSASATDQQKAAVDAANKYRSGS
jgi:hypothetical protein